MPNVPPALLLLNSFSDNDAARETTNAPLETVDESSSPHAKETDGWSAGQHLAVAVERHLSIGPFAPPEGETKNESARSEGEANTDFTEASAMDSPPRAVATSHESPLLPSDSDDDGFKDFLNFLSAPTKESSREKVDGADNVPPMAAII